MHHSIHQLAQPALFATHRGSHSHAVLIAILALAVAVTISPQARAVIPPPDGGYPNANTAEGDQALFSLTTGIDNVAVGFNSLFSNTIGNFNSALGFYSMANNTNGNNNTATGALALQSNTAGNNNTAVGFDALYSNTSGNGNTAHGANALYGNTSGNNNIGLGANAGLNLTVGSYNIAIGNRGSAGDARTIRIGQEKLQVATYIAGINGATVASGVGVVVDGTGRLGTVTSSQRFKEAIKPMGKTSEALLALQPVTFHYKPELDPEGIPQFGLLAEQVAKVSPALVARDGEGKPYTVRYEAVNAMLLNEFLKEHHKIEEQTASIAQLKSALAEQAKQMAALLETVRAQSTQIRKVAAELAASKSEPRLVSEPSL